MDKTSLGDRMKHNYENVYRIKLPKRMPVIIRIDGKSFHTLTKKMDKPYDKEFKDVMMGVAEYLVENIMGCKFAYVQSDEISLLLVNYDKLETEAWFDNNLQKMASISASMATAKFNELYANISEHKKIVNFGMFDSKIFVIPREEVVNYFIFRQQDATCNSIQGLGQVEFGHNRIYGHNIVKVQDMLMLEKGINWNDVDTYFKRGGCVYRGITTERIIKREKFSIKKEMKTIEDYESKTIDIPSLGYKDNQVIVDMDIPVFTKDRNYIELHVYSKEDRLILADYSNEVMNRHARDIASKILDDVDDETKGGSFKTDSIGRAMTNVASALIEEESDE